MLCDVDSTTNLYTIDKYYLNKSNNDSLYEIDYLII